MVGNERTPENHPQDRAGDRRFWAFVWQHKLYRDFWLICITGLVVVALASNQTQTDDIQANRIEATETSCKKYNELAGSNNASISYIENLILSGAVLPGDEASPAGVKPADWTSIKAGPLSKQLSAQFPDLPTAEERLANAQEQASGLADTKVSPRDCEAEVDAVRKAGGEG